MLLRIVPGSCWAGEQHDQRGSAQELAASSFYSKRTTASFPLSQYNKMIKATDTLSISPEVMQVGDFFHTEPTEFTATYCTGHMITAPIIHLDNVSTTSWAWLDVIC